MNNTQLIDQLVSKGIITSHRVANAMKAVDRGDFVKDKALAYEDRPSTIGFNVNISAPHMHAYCIGWLEDVLQPGAKVLDVGSGSGYLCAVFYEFTRSKVVGIEHISDLCKFSLENLIGNYSLELSDRQIEIVCGDGRRGFPDSALY